MIPGVGHLPSVLVPTRGLARGGGGGGGWALLELTDALYLHIHLANVTVTVFDDMLVLVSIKKCFAFLCSTSDVRISWVHCQCQNVVDNVYSTETTWNLKLLVKELVPFN